MTKKNKLLNKLKGANKTFNWSELVTLLAQLGFVMKERAGSRVVFIHQDTTSIHVHRPHPEPYIKGGALKAVKGYLEKRGDL